MKTVKEEGIFEIIINKSKFIGIICNVKNENEVNLKIKRIKKIYKDATHYCYAYITKFKEKCFDDGEPSGTGGIPILNVLKKNKLTDVLCIVVRYFGGIKLGSGGLVRAYSSSASGSLQKCTTGTLEKGYLITIEFNYENVKSIDYVLKNYDIIKNYEDKITYTFEVPLNDYKTINEIQKYCKVIKKEEILIIV